MARVAWLVLIVMSLSACKRKPQEDPAQTKLSDARPLPDRGTAEVLPAQKVTAVGDAEGKPVVAWIEAGAVQVRRWDGQR